MSLSCGTHKRLAHLGSEVLRLLPRCSVAHLCGELHTLSPMDTTLSRVCAIGHRVDHPLRAHAITVERLAPAGERVARAIGAVVLGAGLFLIAVAAGLA